MTDDEDKAEHRFVTAVLLLGLAVLVLVLALCL